MNNNIGRPSYQWLLVCLLSLNFGIVFFDRNALGYLMPFIQKDLSLSNVQIGALTSVLSLSWAIASFLLGRIADALNRRKLVLVVCTVIFSCTSFVTGIAGSFAALLAARLLMGVAEGGVMPISQALILHEVNPARRGLAMGVMQNFGSNLLGNFLGPVVLIAIAAAYGWRNAFFLAGAPGLLMAMVLLFFVTEPRIEKPAAGEAKSKGVTGELLRHRNVVICMMMAVLLVGFVMIFGTFMPLVLVNERGLDQETMSWLMGTYGLSSMACAFLVPGASDIFGRRPVVITISALGALIPIAALLDGSTLGFIFLLFALGAAITGVFPIVMATIPSETVEPHLAATVLGLAMGTGEIVGGVLAPMAAGGVADAFGLRATLWIMIGLCLGTSLLALAVRETAPAILRRRQAGEPLAVRS